MEYSFRSGYYNEGNRIFIKVPFNVWDTCVKNVNGSFRIFLIEPFKKALLFSGCLIEYSCLLMLDR